MSKYYVAKDGGETTGPYPEEEIRALIESCELAETDMVCQEGWEQWFSVGQVFSPAGLPPLPQIAPPAPPPVINNSTVTTLTALPQIDFFIPERAKAQAVKTRVEKLLTKEEMVIAVAAQAFSAGSPDGAVLTNRRVLLIRPQLGGLKMVFNDWLWVDIQNIHIEEGVLGTRLTVKAVNGSFGFVERLDKEEARAVYRIAQQLEELARLGRHNLNLETLRAGSALLRREH
jgi:hypothetical protein